MDSEARLMRALAADRPPARDYAFELAVIREAEAKQYRGEAIYSMLRGGALAAALASAIVPVIGLSASVGSALQAGMLGAAVLITLVGATRIMTERLAAAWAR